MSGPARGRVEVAVEDDLSTEDRSVLVDGLVGYNRAQGYVWEGPWTWPTRSAR